MKLCNKILTAIGGVFLILAVAIILINILTRTVINKPVQGVYEMIGLCAVVFISASIPICTLAESHITVEVLVQRFSKVPRMVFEIVSKVADCALGILFAYAGYQFVLKMIAINESTDSLRIPIAPFRICWIVCSVLILAFSLGQLFRIPRKYKSAAIDGGSESSAERETGETE